MIISSELFSYNFFNTEQSKNYFHQKKYLFLISFAKFFLSEFVYSLYV